MPQAPVEAHGSQVGAGIPLGTPAPHDPADVWAGECVVAIDTGCGNGGFLTAIELPSLTIYESR